MTVVPARPDGRVDAEALMGSIDDRTRLVVVTHMPTHLGTVTDVGRHRRAARRLGRALRAWT